MGELTREREREDMKVCGKRERMKDDCEMLLYTCVYECERVCM